MNILEEANEVIGERGSDYGSVNEDFDRIAKLWSVIFDTEITGDKVALAMITLKISRQLNKHKRDNIVDIAGYARTLEMYESVIDDLCNGDIVDKSALARR